LLAAPAAGDLMVVLGARESLERKKKQINKKDNK
jgi:hypothetical protein